MMAKLATGLANTKLCHVLLSLGTSESAIFIAVQLDY
jgi:hypothetical protein